MAEIERFWFLKLLTGEPLSGIWAPGPDPDFGASFREAGTASAADAFAAWHAECENSRKLANAAGSLDAGGQLGDGTTGTRTCCESASTAK
jgi:hypothetical protein